MTKLDDMQATFYIDSLCRRADDVLRLAYILTGQANDAKKCTKKAFDAMAVDIGSLINTPDLDSVIAEQTWRSFKALKLKPEGTSLFQDVPDKPFLSRFGNLQMNERAAVGLIDFAHLHRSLAAKVMGLSESDISDCLASGREKLTTGRAKPSRADVFSFVGEHLDGGLPDELVAAFAGFTEETNSKELIDQFAQTRGRIQVELQQIQLSSSELEPLRRVVQPKDVEDSLEESDIDDVARRAVIHLVLRYSVFTVLLTATVWGTLQYLSPPPGPTFNALEALTYEALAMDQDDEDERIAFPSSSLTDIRQFFREGGTLGFEPHQLTAAPKLGWTPKGSTIIDYEVAKIAATMFADRQQDSLFHFVFLQGMELLPQSDEIKERGIVFRTYASDELNLIAWQYPDGNTLGFLVGRLAADDLVHIASRSIAKQAVLQ